MDWNNPSEEQMQFLIRRIPICWPSIQHLMGFLPPQEFISFPLPSVELRYKHRSSYAYEKFLREYIEYLQELGFVGDLLQELRKWSGFAKPMKEWSEAHPDKESSRAEAVLEPTGPDEKQLEVMINDIIQRFDNLLHFCMYLIDQKADFPRPPMDFDPKTFEKHLRAYVKEAVQWGWATKLYEKWKEMPPYVDPLEKYLYPEPNWDDLSGKQLKVIRDAIEKAFPNPKDFDLFLSDTFDKGPLSNHSAAGGFAQQLYDFLRDVRAAGWAKNLVIALEATKRSPVRKLTSDLVKTTSLPSQK